MATSIGCSLSVQFAGIFTVKMLLSAKSFLTSSVHWPRKQSKSTKAGCDFLNFKSSLFVTKGMRISLMYRLVVSSLNQWLSVCQMSHSLGKETLGWQRGVFPLYINCGGRYSPVVHRQQVIIATLHTNTPHPTYNPNEVGHAQQI